MITNLEYYKVFYYVATYGSLTLAAEHLHVSQPAVSQSLKSLESDLGIKLFKRVSRGVVLTGEAAALFDYVKRAVNELEAGESKIKEILDLEEGEVKIGASDMTLQFFLLPYLEDFHEKCPNIKITVTNAPTPETLENLKNHYVDFGIVSTPFDVPAFVKSVPCKDIQDTFVAGRRYLRLRNKTLDFKDLEKLPIVALEKGTSTRAYMDAFLENKGVGLKPEFELATSDMIVQFALKNMGIGCVVRDFAKPFLEDGTLFELRFSQMIPKRNFSIVCDNRSEMSHAAKALIKLLPIEV